MSKINCFENTELPLKEEFDSLINDSMSEQEEKLIGLKLAIDYYKKLHSELNSLKETIGLSKDKLVLPKVPVPAELQKPAVIEKPKEAEKLKTVRGIFSKNVKTNSSDEIYRLKLAEELNRFEGENWKKVEDWLKANFPNIPVYRVKNMIQATNGRQAWGMLHKGAIYLTSNAEVGTAYHEVFEAVWKMFTDNSEQQSVLQEFKQRKGSFKNRFTGETIKYSEASDLDIKEELAEEFRDYVLEGKLPAKPTIGKSGISKLFAELFNFLKEFFTGKKAQINTANLFSKIGNGYYKDLIPYESELSFAKKGIIDTVDVFGDETSEFRIAYVQKHELMQQMTYSTLADLVKTNKGLFGINKIKKKDLYNRLREELLSTDPENPGILNKKAFLLNKDAEERLITRKVADDKIIALEELYEKIEKDWDEIVAEHTIYLKQYSIEFDENDTLLIENEEKDKGGDGHADARKVDYFRKANPAVKLLLSTIPQLEEVDGSIEFKRTSIGGVSTLPLDRTFITLKNKLYDSLDIDDMMKKLAEIAKNDINYTTLYTRLTKSSSDSVDYNNLKEPHDIELLSAFYKAMKAQNADVKIVYILPSGEVQIGDAHLASAVRQIKSDLFGDIVSKLKSKHPYVAFNTVEKEYNATDTIKKLTLKSGNKDAYIAFLKAIGVDITKKELAKLTPNQYRQFEEAVNGIKTGIESFSKVKDLNKYTIDLEGRLTGLATVKAILMNPDFESTYFNINGERNQTYIGTNVVSDLYQALSKVKKLSDLKDTPFAYLLTDEFTKGSVILNSIFNPATGNRREGKENILSTGIVEGIIDETKGKAKESGSITTKDRLIQELNLNHEGWFLNLVPGDASIEWMVKLFDKSSPFVSAKNLEVAYDDDSIFEIFREYFISELEVSRSRRYIPYVKGRENTDLRFFKAILDKATHDKVVADTKSTTVAVYNKNKAAIDSAVKNFIKDQAGKTFNYLKDYGVIKYGEKGMEVDNLAFAPEGITENQLLLELEASQANYMIANIELHKLIYSDPYFYKDELKRIKNFNSPAQSLMSSDKVNEAIHRVYNKNYKKGSIGWTNFNVNYLVSAVTDDVVSFIKDLDGYESWDETDGGGVITLQAYRNLRIRAASWTDSDEKQYRHDIKYEELVKSGARKEEIEQLEKSNPKVKSAYTPLKPIVRGSKQDDNSYNDVVLDKFALVPLSFRILHQLNPKSNAIRHYQKMIDTGVDYTVYSTGRKVGANITNSLYEKEGDYNSAPFVGTSNIPFSIMSIQTEVPSKDKPEVTQGSQVTKLATMDFMDAGVPLDFEPDGKIEDRFAKWIALSDEQKEKESELYRLIKNNEELLVERIQHGYETLLNRLGIRQTGAKFEIKDADKLIETLTSEIYKREVNENIIDAFRGFKSGDVVLEATPAYQQIRNILYSIANKQVARPKISGGLKVQIPSTMLESVRPIGNKEGKYESDILKFYENKDGERVCEIMVGRWFDSDLSDEDLLKYLNTTDEGKKLLSGIGFRIPTQKQNSIDVFRIKQFLPAEFGDSVVIPSALVKKVGSDFDIDKLSVYLKNAYRTLKGDVKVVPFFGYGQQAKDKLAEMYDNGDFLTDKARKTANKWIKNRKIEDQDETTEELFKAIFGEEQFDETYTQEVLDDILSSGDIKEKVVNEKYRQSLENQYIESLEEITSHPLNYDKLITPNSAEPLKKLSADIVKKLGYDAIDYSSVGNMLDRNFMERLRNAFVRGKYAIGIAATAQTNNAQNQRTNIFIDEARLKDQSPDDKKFLGDVKIKFKKYNSINGAPTLSLSKNAEGKLVSDLIGMFIDGYVDISKGPWIMELGATPNVAPTWLFLIKLGVPIEDVAYFMNQPIIKDLLKDIENAGYSWIFNSTAIDNVKDTYDTGKPIKVTSIPSTSDLEEMIGKKKLTDTEKAQQLFILDEFLKYSKLAEQLFHVQQASNFDTATINDPFVVFKKKMQLEKAQKMMISSVDDLLNKSFVGKLKDRIFDIRDAFSTILISDKPGSVRTTLEQVLLPYVELQDRDFIKVSQKAVNDLFDWAVQTDQNFTSKIRSVLLGGEDVNSAAEEIMNFVRSIDEDHPLADNYIIKSIRQTRDSVKENTPHNLYITGKLNKTYDQNNVIYGFSEIKGYLESEGNLALYTKLVDLAVLQSGLSNSKISFTQLLPYEDFKDIYNETLYNLDKMTNLQTFVDLNVFERNNWNNPDIVSAKKSQWLKLKNPYEDYRTGRLVQWVKVPEIEFLPTKLKKAINSKLLPQLIQLSRFTKEAREEFVVLTWEKDISKQEKQKLRKKGDYSYIQKGLFQKVYDQNGDPLMSVYTNKKGDKYESYIYKPINAWGDSFRANEFYDSIQPSKLDNGFIQVKEVEDIAIEKTLYPEKESKPSVKEAGTTELPECF